MPRRLFVPLPDAANREKVLGVILRGEEVDRGMDVAEVARMAEGFSGSDLKNLCIAAAYCPIRELLAAERQRAGAGGDAAGAKGKAAVGAPVETPAMRPIMFKDFEAAAKQITASTHAESASMTELARWNEQFGEGGSRRSEPLVYFT
jgi:SpoVK/Ycf46/Vps4 family AAA+-type ATPase